MSDKNLTQECFFCFFLMLEYDDVVLADRDFTIEEDIASCGAKLELQWNLNVDSLKKGHILCSGHFGSNVI